MGASYERGLILYRQSRYALAVDEFRKELSEFPGSSVAHSMLGMSLLNLKKHAEARSEIYEAIRIGPDVAYGYYALAHVALHARPRQARAFSLGYSKSHRVENLENARRHVLDAIRLDPKNPAYFGLLSAIEWDRSRWSACLEAAEKGLAIRPDDRRCTLLRTQALGVLGRDGEVGPSLDLALRNDPEHAGAHLHRGWFMLRQGKPAQAIEHFTEALRLEPNQTKARAGLRQAKRASFPPYRWALQMFLLASGGRPRGMLRFIITSLAMTVGFCRDAFDLPTLIAVLCGVFIFGLLSFRPLQNLFGLFDRRERQSRSPGEIAVAALVGCWSVALTVLIMWIAILKPDQRPAMLPVVLCITPWLPVAVIRGAKFGIARRRAMATAAGVEA